MTPSQWYQKCYHYDKSMIDGYVPRPQWTEEETNAAKSLRDSGFSYLEISEKLMKTPKAVKNRLQRIK